MTGTTRIASIGVLILASGVAFAQTPSGTTSPAGKTTPAASADKAPAAAPDKGAQGKGDKQKTTAASGATTKPSTRAQDREVTASVRKVIEKDRRLSPNARNVKVMTINSVVTLSGPVANAAEKDRVGELAKQVAGVSDVINRVDVPPPKPPKKKKPSGA